LCRFFLSFFLRLWVAIFLSLRFLPQGINPLLSAFEAGNLTEYSPNWELGQAFGQRFRAAGCRAAGIARMPQAFALRALVLPGSGYGYQPPCGDSGNRQKRLMRAITKGGDSLYGCFRQGYGRGFPERFFLFLGNNGG
jgi:hypothetical protein